MTTLIGTCKWFNKSYGYITGSDNVDYFVHQSNILTGKYRYLETGEAVNFTPEKNDKGPIAINVQVLSPRTEKTRSFRDNAINKGGVA